jgi:outer membrane biosynthesis protein TonB
MVSAVYEVRVGAGGVAESIVVAQSSGMLHYDEAGASMIRSTMTFEPPTATRRAVTSVVVRFLPEQR